MALIIYNVRDEALNSMFKPSSWGGNLLPLFYAQKGVRVTVRATFRVTLWALQKRNVMNSVTFRVTLLTFLQVLFGGTLPK